MGLVAFLARRLVVIRLQMMNETRHQLIRTIVSAQDSFDFNSWATRAQNRKKKKRTAIVIGFHTPISIITALLAVRWCGLLIDLGIKVTIGVHLHKSSLEVLKT
jgi:hypothetical protein